MAATRVVNTNSTGMAVKRKGKGEQKEMPVAYFRAEFDSLQPEPRAFSDRGRLPIVRNLQARFRRRACAERAQNLLRACTRGGGDQDRAPFQRRSRRRSRRVNWFRARACTRDEQGWHGRRERGEGGLREKEGKRGGKGKRRPRAAERSFASGVRSWRGRTCNRVS